MLWREKFKVNNSVFQCFNCLEYGHVAYDCFKSCKCLKCDGPHYFKNCINDNVLKCENITVLRYEDLTSKEVKKCISLLRNTKIRTKMNKMLSRKGIVALKMLFNSWIHLYYCPVSGRLSVTVPLPKPVKDASLIENIGSVSLVSNISNIYKTKTCYKQLN